MCFLTAVSSLMPVLAEHKTLHPPPPPPLVSARIRRPPLLAAAADTSSGNTSSGSCFISFLSGSYFICALTAHAGDEDRRECLAAGAPPPAPPPGPVPGPPPSQAAAPRTARSLPGRPQTRTSRCIRARARGSRSIYIARVYMYLFLCMCARGLAHEGVRARECARRMRDAPQAGLQAARERRRQPPARDPPARDNAPHSHPRPAAAAAGRPQTPEPALFRPDGPRPSPDGPGPSPRRRSRSRPRAARTRHSLAPDAFGPSLFGGSQRVVRSSRLLRAHAHSARAEHATGRRRRGGPWSRSRCTSQRRMTTLISCITSCITSVSRPCHGA